ncbi:MAG: hypothetical protein V4604_04550 [Bacteroidota bacterium]
MEKQKYIVLAALAVALSTLFLPVLETHFLDKKHIDVQLGYEIYFFYPLYAFPCLLAYFIPFEDKTKALIVLISSGTFYLFFLLVLGFALSFGGGSAIREDIAIGFWVLLGATIFLFVYGLLRFVIDKFVRR